MRMVMLSEAKAKLDPVFHEWLQTSRFDQDWLDFTDGKRNRAPQLLKAINQELRDRYNITLEVLEIFGRDISNEIKSISIESRGVSGSLSGHVFLSVSCSTPEGLKSLKYYMYEEHANKALDQIDNRRLKSKAPEELKRIIHRLVKPKGQVNLRDVAMDSSIRPLVAATRGEEPNSLSEEAICGQVMDVVATLILDGQLEGVITDDGEYVSNVMLARKTVQYQVVIDFNSLYSQLQGKGIVLQNIECPSCNAHLDYPESGSIVVCKYCGSTVNAVDIFEKFKNLL